MGRKMSVLIKGSEFPKNCAECWALDEYGDYPVCRITQEQRGYTFRTREQRMERCPLVEVPSHGRLVDADKIGLTDFEIIMCNGDFKEALKMLLDKIDYASTIVPAEENQK